MKAEKEKLFDEQIAKRLHDEEVEQAAAREKKYQHLKRKPVSIAQARKNIIIYLKNMARYKMEHFRGMTYDKVIPIFKREYKKVQTLFKPDKDVEEPQKKSVAKETLLQESFKKLKAIEVSGSESTQETLTNDPKEIKKDYLLSNGVMTLMLSAKLQVEEDSEMARDLVMKIFMETNKPKSRKDVIRSNLGLDDADGVECLPNEEIFTVLVRMGYENLPPKLTFYKAFFSAQWKFLIHTLVQCVSAKRTAWNEFSCSMASAVICLATETYATLSQKVAELDQDKHTQALEIIRLKKRVKKLEKKKKSKSLGLKSLKKKRIGDDNADTKDVNVAEPTIFDDEEVTMTMAQTLIKTKAEKAKLLDEQIAKRLHDEEVEQAATREKQENDDLKRAQVLQKQYDNKEENID
uniref:Glutamic acid-rich protein-like n=1 Tax=Tanacetum cinerariifolium TaxID=118510 RepID=A0A6L2MHL3_TANCI|nr:hypothetical protein [Tanacetum cinerariifolium]